MRHFGHGQTTVPRAQTSGKLSELPAAGAAATCPPQQEKVSRKKGFG